MKKITLYILMFLTFISCEKEVDIDIERTEPKLVVNALFNTDSLWKIEVSKSKFVFDTNKLEFVDNAEISIENSKGEIILLSNKGNGIYTSSTEKPEVGESYSLEVSHGSLPTVNSNSSLPGSIEIQELKKGGTYIFQNYAYKELVLSFLDSPDEDNYMIEVSVDYYWYEYDTITWQITDSFLVKYPTGFFTNSNFVENSGPNSYSESISFSDEYFNGNLATISLLLDEYYFDEFYGANSIYVSISKISKDYYLYQTSYNKYLLTQGNPFAQPVQVYTNIQNGFGIFAGYSTTTDSIAIK